MDKIFSDLDKISEIIRCDYDCEYNELSFDFCCNECYNEYYNDEIISISFKVVRYFKGGEGLVKN